MSEDIQIVKSSGETELFDKTKVEQSLQRAGADASLSKNIALEIEGQVKNGMTTKEIYKKAFSLLEIKERALAARYSLKKAIFQLGPEGYPFEKFVGKILERLGYETKVGQIVQGKCVTHEIDVIAEKKGEHLLVECKFHNYQGIKSDVQTALYTKARFDDVQEGMHLAHQNTFHQVWLVTNTKVTKDAAQYGKCQGMKVIGWNYPGKESLQIIIEKSGLHPLTCLPGLSSGQKRQLLGRGVVLCRELKENPHLLEQVGIRGKKQEEIINNINQICP